MAYVTKVYYLKELLKIRKQHPNINYFNKSELMPIIY